MKLGVIVPTVARPTLERTVRSIVTQERPPDLVVVAVDSTDLTVLRAANTLVSAGVTVFSEHRMLMGPRIVMMAGPNGSDWGHTPANRALNRIGSFGVTHVARLDDDDVYLPGATGWMRDAACDRPVIFRMRFGDNHPASGLELPHGALGNELRHGNVGTPMVLAPLTDCRYGQGDYSGDFTYVQALVDSLGEPIWRPECVTLVRP